MTSTAAALSAVSTRENQFVVTGRALHSSRHEPRSPHALTMGKQVVMDASNNNATRERKRIDWLDWVRGVAAVSVMLHHFAEKLSPEYADFSRTYFDMGRAGVVAFFVASGFVIPLTYARQRTDVFFVRRVTRLYPLYLLILLITVLVQPQGSWSDPRWWLEIALNATMLQELVIPSLVGVAWTLTIEWLFYYQQIGAKLIGVLEKSWVLAYAWTGVFVLMVIAEYVTGSSLPITIPCLLAAAFLGQAFSMWYFGSLGSRAFLTSLTIVIGVLAIASASRSSVEADVWPGPLYAISFVGGLAFVLVAYLLRNKLRLPWAVWLGSLSYAVYLVHSLLTELPDLTDSAPVKWALAGVGIVGTVLISWFLHENLEQKFITWGRKYSPRQRNYSAP